MVRINANITIVDMVQQRPKIRPVNATEHHECINEYAEIDKYDNITGLIEGWNITAKRGYSLERAWLDSQNVEYDERGFLWNEHQQGLVLGAFYWMHWVTQIPGGMLARRYGTKIVFGLANLIACLLCSLMPIASYYNFRILIFLRVLQGFITVSRIENPCINAIIF